MSHRNVLLSLAWAIITPAGTVSACSSIPPLVVPAFANSDAVFVGRAASRSPTRWYRGDGTLGEGYAVEFVVVKWWKGGGEERVIVATGLGNGDCGYPFEVGQEYLVYAHARESGELATWSFTRTGLLILRLDDIAELVALLRLKRLSVG